MTASASAAADVARGEGLLLERPWCGGGRPLATSPRHMAASEGCGGEGGGLRLGWLLMVVACCPVLVGFRLAGGSSL